MPIAEVKKSDEIRVYVVDDDEQMREAVAEILRAADIEAEGFESTEEFLSEVPASSGGCLVLDIRMPQANGLDFQTELASMGYKMPIIFMTGFGSIPMTVQAMKAGAVDFLTKPFDDQQIISAVSAALRRDAEQRARDSETDAVVELAKSLTTREKQVMAGVVKGLMNKQIAYELSLTEITVKLHRASLMKKMRVRTLPDLVRKAEVLTAISNAQEASFSPAVTGAAEAVQKPTA